MSVRDSAEPGGTLAVVVPGPAKETLAQRDRDSPQGQIAAEHSVGVRSLIFGPRTGALLDVANAQCDIPVGAIPTATGQCTPTDCTEFNAPRAVSAVPRYKAHLAWLYLQGGGPFV